MESLTTASGSRAKRHETLWGTVGGAWESGERAADAVLKSFGRKTG